MNSQKKVLNENSNAGSITVPKFQIMLQSQSNCMSIVLAQKTHNIQMKCIEDSEIDLSNNSYLIFGKCNKNKH